MSNGRRVEDNLRLEAKRLYKCIQKYIDDYYNSYEPKSNYERTFRFKEALYAEDFVDIKTKGNVLQITIRFNSDLAYHPSVAGGIDGYVPLLINDGWCWNGWEDRPDDHFHKYSGFHFLEKGIEEWNATNKFGFTVTLDKRYEGDSYQNSIYR